MKARLNHPSKGLDCAGVMRRARQTRLGILLLLSGGMCRKQVAGLLRLGQGGLQWHEARIRRRMGNLYESARRMATTRQEDWGL